MEFANIDDFLDFFEDLDDPRDPCKCVHTLGEILLVTLCGTLSGCETWGDIELFGKERVDFLRGWLSYEQGTPSDDTLRRFFRALDPEQFQYCLFQWAEHLFGKSCNEHIAIDGKSVRGTRHQNEKMLHLVSAYSCDNGIVLCSQRTHDKSNEITAIPDVLDLLDIEGSIVSIDAMGCQVAIADQINEKGGDYLFSLKGNQGSLHDDVKTFCDTPSSGTSKIDVFDHVDKGHGRIEERKCTVFHGPDWLHKRNPKWSSIKTIGKVTSIRHIGENTSEETRYFISSRILCAEKFLSATRNHWGIENSLHWVLDVTFNEDGSLIGEGHAPENMAIVRKFAINLLRLMKQSEKHKRKSFKVMRKACGWNTDFLVEVITSSFMR